jgi:hypothetical protein
MGVGFEQEHLVALDLHETVVAPVRPALGSVFREIAVVFPPAAPGAFVAVVVGHAAAARAEDVLEGRPLGLGPDEDHGVGLWQAVFGRVEDLGCRPAGKAPVDGGQGWHVPEGRLERRLPAGAKTLPGIMSVHCISLRLWITF